MIGAEGMEGLWTYLGHSSTTTVPSFTSRWDHSPSSCGGYDGQEFLASQCESDWMTNLFGKSVRTKHYPRERVCAATTYQSIFTAPFIKFFLFLFVSSCIQLCTPIPRPGPHPVKCLGVPRNRIDHPCRRCYCPATAVSCNDDQVWRPPSAP